MIRDNALRDDTFFSYLLSAWARRTLLAANLDVIARLNALGRSEGHPIDMTLGAVLIV